jgi:hypothetical protein
MWAHMARPRVLEAREGKIKKATPPGFDYVVVCTSVFMEGLMQAALRISSCIPPHSAQVVVPP